MITPDAGPLDPDAGPVWRQLAARLRKRIASGELTGRLPGERTIGQEYGVAVGTVRKAVAVLRDEGMIETVHGWGSRVVSREPRPLKREPG